MFEKEELALIHKAVSELTIKGSDSHIVSNLLNKVATQHAKPEKPAKVKVEK
jgi:hypothetical protein|tara:strand:+ start:128 stop:283 length:156 start_codon:yes stop_codon:yes gene_type:complete